MKDPQNRGSNVDKTLGEMNDGILLDQIWDKQKTINTNNKWKASYLRFPFQFAANRKQDYNLVG